MMSYASKPGPFSRVQLPSALESGKILSEWNISEECNTESTTKDLSRSLYLRKKQAPGRFSEVRKRERKSQYVKKLLKKVNSHEPHSGEDLPDLFRVLPSYVKDLAGLTESYDGTLLHVENILLFLYHLSKAEHVSDYICTTITFMKMYLKTSISKLLVDMVDFMNEEDQRIPDEIRIDTQSASAQALKDSWDMLRNHTIFPKVAFLITAAMASSVCSIKELELDFAGIKLIHLEAQKTQVGALDIIDAAIHTFTWLCDTGWCCIQERSLSPLLYSDQRLRVYTDDCNYLLSMADAVRAGNVKDLHEFERKLDKCLRVTSEMQKATSSLSIKEVLQRKYAALISVKNDLIAKRRNTDFRKAPIGFSISGPSSIGKSGLAELTMKHSLNAMGYSDKKEGIITLNEADKYDSTYTSDVVGVFIDDAANCKSQFVEKSPTQKYIQFFNNMAAQAVKAEINEKGCVFINFAVGVVTTNVKHLDAALYSNYPVAVLRRFIHVSAAVQPRYRIPGGASLNVDHPDIINADPDQILDVWEFKVETVSDNGSGASTFTVLDLIMEDGSRINCTKIDLRTYLRVVVRLSQLHEARQVKQVVQNQFLEKTICCPTCKMLPQYCVCIPPSSPPNGGPPSVGPSGGPPGGPSAPPSPPRDDDNTVSCLLCGRLQTCCTCRNDEATIATNETQSLGNHVLRSMVLKYVSSQFSFYASFLLDYFFTDCTFLNALKNEVHDMINEFTLLDHLEVTAGLLPTWISNSRWFRHIAIDYRLKRRCFRSLRARNFLGNFIVGIFILLICTQIEALFYVLIVAILAWTYCDCMIVRERKFVNDLISHNSSVILRRYGQMLQANWKRTAAVTITAVAAVSTFLVIWNNTRRTPHTLDNYADVAKAPGWFGFAMKGNGGKNLASRVAGSTCKHLMNVVRKNLAWARFAHSDGDYVAKSNVFFPRKSLMLLPKHTFYKDGDMRKPMSDLITCTIHRNNTSGGVFSCKIRYSMCYQFPEMDLVAAWIPNCPDIASVLRWFPKEKPEGSTIGQIVGFTEELEYTSDAISAQFGKVSHTHMTMYGASYETELARKGACMSAVLSDVAEPAIIGLHIGGNSRTNAGICVTCTEPQIEDAMKHFETAGYFMSANATTIPETQCDKSLLVSKEIHPKALHLQQMGTDYEVHKIGSVKLRNKHSSAVEPSFLSERIEKHCGVPNTWGPPAMKCNWIPFNANVDKFGKPGKMFDPLLLERAKRDWLQPILDVIPTFRDYESSEGVDTMRPLTMRETIMGINGIRFIDPIPMNTGTGFPNFGPKNKVDAEGIPLYFVEEFDDRGRILNRIPTPLIVKEYERLRSCYLDGDRAYPVTTATLKDEPTKVDKIKVRVFQAAPVALGLLIRMYCLPVARFLCMHPILAELAVGVNAFGPQWKELMDHATKYSSDDKMLGWDYSSFDVRMNSQITRTVWNTFIEIAQAMGYPDEALTIMKNMIVDICHPLIDMNGSMLMAMAMNTSGNNMTVYVNSVAGSLYARMGFFHVFPKERNFRECVALLTYGDDATGSVRKEFEEFNFITYKRFLEEHDMGLTLPDKTNDEVAFLHKAHVDFLKRKSVHIEEIGTEIGALDEDSIFKCLHSNVRSKKVTKKEVACSCVEVALHEWFAHGREHYEMRRQQLIAACAEDEKLVVEALKYTFDDRVAKWKEGNLNQFLTEEETLDEEENDPQSSGEQSSLDTESDADLALAHLLYTSLCGGGIYASPISRPPYPDNNNTHLIGSSNPSADERGSGPNGHDSEAGESARDSHSPQCVAPDTFPQPRVRPNRVRAPTMGTLYHQVRCAQGILNSLERNLQDLLIASVEDEPQHVSRMAIHFEDEIQTVPSFSQFDDADSPGQYDDAIEPQSAEEHPMADSEAAEPSAQTPNIQFTDAHPGFHDSRGTMMDPLRGSIPDDEVALDKFFMRPIKIRDYEWEINSNLNETFDPWALYFENKRVINKLANYRLMSATLHVKFLLNGTGLHYGRALVSYRPLDDFDALTISTPSQNGLCLASQRPHLYLNPTISQGGCLTLPFFTPFNMLDITTAQWRQMGQIDINSLTTLKHASGSPTPIRISVLAWATNVTLSGLTTQNPALIVPQSSGEYTGILSKPASAVAKIAGVVRDIPMLSRFAMATEIGASSIAYMANFFGFSKPPGMHPGTMTVVANDNSINCDGRKSLHKLTVDSQQELTVDPAVAGLDSVDELTISSIATRESYLTRFRWQESDDPEKLLFNAVVDPGVIRWNEAWTSEIAMTSLGFAATPFLYWRGSVRYRFQVVSSSFHSGRLRIVWDPFGTPLGGADYNTAYAQVIDVSENNDFVVEIGWGQSTTWRNVMQTQQPPDYAYSPTQLTDDSVRVPYNGANIATVGNGTISVYVMNSLISPDSTIDNDVVVLVSVSGGDDMEFAVPTNKHANFQLSLAPTSSHVFSGSFDNRVLDLQFPGLAGNVPQSGSDAEQRTQAVGLADVGGNPTQQKETLQLGPPPIMDALVNKIYMGETIVSFRSLLKRFTFHEWLLPRGLVDGPNRISFVRYNFPLYSGHTGAVPGTNLVRAVPSGNVIQGCNSLLNYLGPAYAGWRGGIRYIIDTSYNNERNANRATNIHINLLHTNQGDGAVRADYDDGPIYFDPSLSNVAKLSTGYFLQNTQGGYPTSDHVNPLQCFEIPYQQQYRFCPSRQGIRAGTDLFQQRWEMEIYSLMKEFPDSLFPKWVAAGEDFTFLFYLGPPILYYRPSRLPT